MSFLSRCALALVAALATGAPLPAAAAPLLSELFYDAVGSDNGLSLVELYGAPGSALDGLRLDGVNGGDGAVCASGITAGSALIKPGTSFQI